MVSRKQEKKSDIDIQEIIINRPSLMTGTRMFTEFSVATIGWILWYALMRPVLMLLTWFLGLRFFYVEVIRMKGWQSLGQYGKYFLVIAVIYAVIQGWNFYNIWRFRGKDRRSGAGPVSDADMGSFYQISGQDVASLKDQKVLKVSLLENNKIVFEGERGGEKFEVAGLYDPWKKDEEMRKENSNGTQFNNHKA